jgi:predicted RNase H-like nuclease
MDWGLLQYSNILRTKCIFNVLQQNEQKASYKNITYKFSQMRSKSSHKKILAKKVKNVSNFMQASNTCLIVAADTMVRGQLSEHNKKASKRKDDTNLTCLVSTYEKYFV